MKITNAKEVWIHGKRAGTLAEDWFYPACGVQLSVEELRKIANALAPQPVPVETVKLQFYYNIDLNGTVFWGPEPRPVLIEGNMARGNKSLFDYIQQESYSNPGGRGKIADVRKSVWNEIKEIGRLM